MFLCISIHLRKIFNSTLFLISQFDFFVCNLPFCHSKSLFSFLWILRVFSWFIEHFEFIEGSSILNFYIQILVFWKHLLTNHIVNDITGLKCQQVAIPIGVHRGVHRGQNMSIKMVKWFILCLHAGILGMLCIFKDYFLFFFSYFLFIYFLSFGSVQFDSSFFFLIHPPCVDNSKAILTVSGNIQ